jgi:polysaccharide deacetylase 2 family uncharacterized protein YibQ
MSLPAEIPQRALPRGARAWTAAAGALAVLALAGVLGARDVASGSASEEPRPLERALDAALGGRAVDVGAAAARRPPPPRPDARERYVAPPVARVLAAPDRPFGRVDADEPARIALVFDDLGYTTDGLAGELLALGTPLTFSVLPGLPRSEAFAAAARARGHEVLLHLPMEPVDPARHDPGERAILASLPAEENLRRLRAQLAGLSLYEGISNHMGSRATATPEVVDLVLGEMKRRNRSLFFLDSRTTPFSVVPERARRAGVPFLCNNLFLDGGDEEPALPAVQTERLESIARRRGHAIGIGHVRPATVAAVEAAVERWRAEGIRLVTLSDLRHP